MRSTLPQVEQPLESVVWIPLTHLKNFIRKSQNASAINVSYFIFTGMAAIAQFSNTDHSNFSFSIPTN